MSNSKITFNGLDPDIIASQVEAEAGTADDKFMTPERVMQAIEATAVLPPVAFSEIDSAALASQSEAEAGAVSNKLMTPERTLQAIEANVPAQIISTAYESSERTITANTIITVTHGLGVVPKLFQVVLRCKNVPSGSGWSVGDEVGLTSLTHSGIDSSTNGRGVVVYANATQLGAIVSEGIILFSRSTPASAVTLTLSDWRLVFRAYA